MTEIGLFSKDMKELLQEKVFVTVVLGQIALWMSSVFHSFCTSAIDSRVSFAYIVSGYIAYNFVIGAYSYWGPKAGQQIYNMVKSCLSLTRGNVVACIWRYIWL